VESLAIAVPAGRAWEALTSPRVLGDLLMGHVEMDTRPGRPFVWQWGVWARAAPRGRGDFTWRGTVLDAVPGPTLILGGAGLTVVFTAKGEGNSSLLTVVQGSAPPGAKLEDYRYGWADFLLRLKTLLEPPAQPDAIYLRTLVRATPAEIIRAWLSSRAMSQILPGNAKIRPQAGGRFEWQWKDAEGVKVSGAFLEIQKNHWVSFTWETTTPPSEVRLAADRAPYGTLVSLVHLSAALLRNSTSSGQAAGAGRRSYERMWAHLLERLRAYFYYDKKIRTG